jgi:outer membrane protein W
MAKKSFFVALGLLLVFPAFLFAGEGSDTIGDENLLLQLRYSYIDNDYDTKYEELRDDEWDFDDITSNSVYLQLDYGITDHIDIYGLIGYRLLDVDIIVERGDDVIRGDMDTFLWGVGLKSTFYRADSGFYFGGGLGLTHAFTPSKTKMRWDNNEVYDYHYQELSLTCDLHAGWRFPCGFNPYFGVEYRYSWMYLEMIDDDEINQNYSGRFEEEHNLGVYAGIDYYLNNKLFFNVEGHVLDYWGVSASFGYLFDSAIPNLSFAGTGGDTIGGKRLLLKMRYAYFEDDFETDWEEIWEEADEDFDFSSHSVYLQLDYGITDYVDIYGLLGYKRVDFDTGENDFDGDFDTFLWGVGLKSTFYRAEKGFYVGGGLGVTHAFTPDKQKIYYYGDDYFEYSEINLTADVHAGWRFPCGFSPYLGVEYRYTWLNLERIHDNGEIDDDSGRFEQENNLGVFVGLEYLINDRFFLNVEGHMVNRWGGSFGVGYMF